MNHSKLVALAAAGLLASQAHAIIGLGGHYAPGLGKLDGSSGEVLPADATTGTTTSLDQKAVSGMQGFGLKLWIDVLPVIDIEGTFNMQFNRYDADLVVANPTLDTELRQPLKVKFDGFPLKEASPAIAAMSGDVTILYPFLKFPPAITVVRLYAGAGLTYFMATPVVDADFTQSVFTKMSADGTDMTALFDPATQEAAAQEFAQGVADAIVDEGLSTGIGGHVMLGARFKLPIIPIAAYANTKYYIGGPVDAYSPGVVFELGGGLAF